MASNQLELEPVASQLPVKQDDFLAVIQQAVTSGAQAEVVGKMLDHYERWQKMQAKKAFDDAMANFKRSVPEVVKNRIADMGKYKVPYADIEGICDTVEPAMMANGFDKRWTTEPSDKGIVMCCIIKHIGGHSETTILPPAPPEDSGSKNDLHALASSFTYLQRYSLLMALGIAARGVDNDGNKTAKGRAPAIEKEYQERVAYFAHCLNADELKEHWMASRAWAREIKDETAVNDFDYLKEKRKKELAK